MGFLGVIKVKMDRVVSRGGCGVERCQSVLILISSIRLMSERIPCPTRTSVLGMVSDSGLVIVLCHARIEYNVNVNKNHIVILLMIGGWLVRT